MTHKNDDEAALPRHWLATTDNPRPDDHPAPTSQGGASSALPDVMWLTRSVIITTPFSPSVGLQPGWVAHETLQWVRDQHPDALSLTDPYSLAHHAYPSPFDPNPPAKTPASNGFIRCPDCETVVEAAGHECDGQFGPKMRRVWVRMPTDLCPRCRRVDLQLGTDGDFYSADCMCDDPDERAEFAESQLGGAAWMHALGRSCDLDREEADCPFCAHLTLAERRFWLAWQTRRAFVLCDDAREVKP